MTTPVLLTAPTPLDTDPLNGERTKRHVGARPPLGFVFPSSSSASTSITLDAVTTTTTTDDHDDDVLDPSAHRALVEERVRQWTGAPIRAIVPLPRRERDAVVQQQQQQQRPQQLRQLRRCPASRSWTVLSESCLSSRGTTLLCCQDDMDSGLEIDDGDGDGDGDEGEEEEEEGEEGDVHSGERYCSYESITAAEGLAAWSFEELRVECYAQSVIARGTKPPPVVQPMLAIPPAFVPRIVPRS